MVLHIIGGYGPTDFVCVTDLFPMLALPQPLPTPPRSTFCFPTVLILMPPSAEPASSPPYPRSLSPHVPVRELDSVDDTNEPTMAEKLASIDLLGDDKTMDTPRKEPSHPAIPPSADSVHVLLKQALHADDHALLLDCLYTGDEKVIAKSTSHLNPSDVLKLLKSLTSMLQLRGAVLICALPWLRSLLSQHASSIASQESSLIMLNSLYQLIESRISTFGSALQLSTSLDYLFATVPEEEADEEAVPAIVYEDKDSDEESEDAMESNEDSELGSVINSPQQSDDGEVMSD